MMLVRLVASSTTAVIAAIYRPQEEVQQSLTGGGVVKYVPNKRGTRSFFDEVAQAIAGSIQSFEKESENGGIPGRQLSRMKVPALIKRVSERVPAVIIVEFPR